MPSLGTIKLIGAGIGALLLAGLLAFAFFTVKGWRDDAAKLPDALDRAIHAEAAYKELDQQMTGTLNGIAGKIDANQARLAALDKWLTANSLSIDADVQNFLRRYSDALKQNAACPVPAAVRDGLLNLFPARPAAKRGAAGGRGEGASPAGSSAAPSAPASVPGRQRAAIDRGEMGMPATTGRVASNSDSAASGAGGETDRRAAQGSGPAVSDEGVGMAGRGWLGRVTRAATEGVRLAGAAALALVQDDGRDG